MALQTKGVDGQSPSLPRRVLCPHPTTMRAALAALLCLSVLADRVRSACECGYLDPTTGDRWTDATITYFNETGLADVATDVQAPPSIYGQETSGETGDGQQAWALIGDHVNDWEESFGATYRSAVSYNNTFIGNQTLGVAMQVSTVDLSTHIVNGSQMVTRRRDMLYGSFRAYILPAPSFSFSGGSAFKFGVSYNARWVRWCMSGCSTLTRPPSHAARPST